MGATPARVSVGPFRLRRNTPLAHCCYYPCLNPINNQHIITTSISVNELKRHVGPHCATESSPVLYVLLGRPRLPLIVQVLRSPQLIHMPRRLSRSVLRTRYLQVCRSYAKVPDILLSAKHHASGLCPVSPDGISRRVRSEGHHINASRRVLLGGGVA
jgi:hypothetical protein